MTTSTPTPPIATAPKVLERVRALLAKAESTTFPDEADAFTAKAQDLMARYRIERAVLDALADEAVAAHGVHRRTIAVDDPYASAKASLYTSVGRAFGCDAVLGERGRVVELFGAPDDLALVDTLVTSLLLQAALRLQAAGPQRGAFGQSTTRSFRHAFYLAYAVRIGERLRESVRRAVDDLDEDQRQSALPVLARRDDAVQEAIARAFPHLETRRTRVSNAAGVHAGRVAADAADLSVGRAVTR